MLNSGDVVQLNLGAPRGREAGFRHPAVVITAQRILEAGPNVVQVVPLTSTLRGFGAEVRIDVNGDTGLEHASAAQCQHLRSVSAERVESVVGNVGLVSLAQIRETVGKILDIPF